MGTKNTSRFTRRIVRAATRLCLSVSIYGAALSVVSLATGDGSVVAQSRQCSSPYLIQRTLNNGAMWDMCWELRSNEGIVLSDVHYTPVAGVRRKVLAYAGIGQIHVVYDDNGARFHDVSNYGLGGTHITAVNDTDCTDGTVRTIAIGDTSVPAICIKREPRGFAYASGANRLVGERLVVFSISTVGKYSYIIQWTFNDDGSIEPAIGATGALQRNREVSAGGVYNRGWLTANNVNGNDRYGISHTHNYYWRLDFDLNGTWSDDIIEELEFAPANQNTRRRLVVRRLTKESARSINAARMRSWRIRDGAAVNAAGRHISYHLEPMDQGHRDSGPLGLQQPLNNVPAWRRNEPWTKYDLYVTVNKTCERFATRNPPFSGDDNNTDVSDDSCLDAGNVAEFAGIAEYPDDPAREVTGSESLVNRDSVLWYGMSFYHLPRDEDEPYMHAHWSSFKLTPRDWHDFNPNANGDRIQLSLDTPDAGEYGHRFGSNQHYSSLSARFQGHAEDVIVRARGYDVDRSGEVIVYLNGAILGRLAATANGKTGAVKQFLVPAAEQLSNNQLKFVQRRPGETWGVTDIEVASIVGARLAPSLNELDRGEYGFKFNGSNSHPDAIRIDFQRNGSDRVLSLRSYDIDKRNEARLYLNGEPFAKLPVTDNNAVGDIAEYALPNTALVSGNNTVTIFQHTKSNRWGITDLTLGDGSGPVIPLRVDEVDRTGYGHRYGTDQHNLSLRAQFSGQGRDIEFKLRGYDIDTPTEVAILLNGAEMGFLPSGENNTLTEVHSLLIPQTNQRAGDNVIELRQTRPGNKWGVKNMRIRSLP